MMNVRYPEKYFFTAAQREREEVAKAFLSEFLEKQAHAAWKRIHPAPESARSQRYSVQEPPGTIWYHLGVL